MVCKMTFWIRLRLIESSRFQRFDRRPTAVSTAAVVQTAVVQTAVVQALVVSEAVLQTVVGIQAVV